MNTLLDPTILFFAVGVLAGSVKSNLEIPAPISRFLSLYLLMALGLKGGFALAQSGWTDEVARSLGAAVLLAVLVPLLGYGLLRRWLSSLDAVAVAATYGSVSAVTFITAVQVLELHGMPAGGHMAAAMALMESPAIVLAVLMANHLRQQVQTSTLAVAGDGTATWGTGPGHAPVAIRKVLHESFTEGTQLLLLGAMVIGCVTGETGHATMKPFVGDLFKGLLAFFLLDMGLLAARQIPQVRGQSPWLLAYAVLGPLCHASVALGLAWLLGIEAGNAALLMVLAASASYIAVPAVLRVAIPEAKPTLYIGLSLGVTFPFNIVLGIPLYIQVAQHCLGG